MAGAMRLGRWELRRRSAHADTRVEIRMRSAQGTLLQVDLDDLRLIALYGGHGRQWDDVFGFVEAAYIPMTVEIRVIEP